MAISLFCYSLKSRFIISKSNIKINKDRCETTKHFNGKGKDSDIFQFLSIQIIEQEHGNAKDIS